MSEFDGSDQPELLAQADLDLSCAIERQFGFEGQAIRCHLPVSRHKLDSSLMAFALSHATSTVA